MEIDELSPNEIILNVSDVENIPKTNLCERREKDCIWFVLPFIPQYSGSILISEENTIILLVEHVETTRTWIWHMVDYDKLLQPWRWHRISENIERRNLLIEKKVVICTKLHHFSSDVVHLFSVNVQDIGPSTGVVSLQAKISETIIEIINIKNKFLFLIKR